MGVRTQRATQAEKAAAWDRVMSSTAANTTHAVENAWAWLDYTVEQREKREQVVVIPVGRERASDIARRMVDGVTREQEAFDIDEHV